MRTFRGPGAPDPRPCGMLSSSHTRSPARAAVASNIGFSEAGVGCDGGRRSGHGGPRRWRDSLARDRRPNRCPSARLCPVGRGRLPRLFTEGPEEVRTRVISNQEIGGYGARMRAWRGGGSGARRLPYCISAKIQPSVRGLVEPAPARSTTARAWAPRLGRALQR